MVSRRRERKSNDLKYWEWLVTALEHLGNDGMSSDDSDDDLRGPVVRVRNMAWRNKSLIPYLEVLDQLKFAFPFSTRGAKRAPRIRSADNRSSSRQFVDLLPSSLYDEGWLLHAGTNPNTLSVHPSKESMEFLEFDPVING